MLTREPILRGHWKKSVMIGPFEPYRISTTTAYGNRVCGLYRDYPEALEKSGALGAAIAAGRKMLASWPAKNEPNCAVMAEEMMEALLERRVTLTAAIAMWQRQSEIGNLGIPGKPHWRPSVTSKEPE